MIGLVVVAHAGLAVELVNAAEMVVGKIELAETVGVGASDDAGMIMDAISGAIRKVSGDGALVLADMFGGTPSNMSLSFLEAGRVEVVTGVNLPMVIEFASKRGKMKVDELAAALRDCGRQSIYVAGDYLKK
ncbi:MAG TPA: PTS sugar transporter [Verrucomicrobiae bacterium]|nr:PTS sugar transporter [Verrucomicrobiae bacterium]